MLLLLILSLGTKHPQCQIPRHTKHLSLYAPIAQPVQRGHVVPLGELLLCVVAQHPDHEQNGDQNSQLAVRHLGSAVRHVTRNGYYYSMVAGMLWMGRYEKYHVHYYYLGEGGCLCFG